MSEPKNTKELMQNIEEFGQVIAEAKRQLKNACDIILEGGIRTRTLSGKIARGAMLHGMDYPSAERYAEDFRASVLLMMRAADSAQECLDEVQNRAASAGHIVTAVANRVPNRHADGVMDLR